MNFKLLSRKNNILPKFVNFILCFLLVFPCALLISCGKNETKITFTNYFNCPITIQSYSKKLSTQATNELKSVLESIESSVSISNSNSFVYKFNELSSSESLVIDDVTTEILQIAVNDENSLYKITNGKFNVAVYPLKELWQNKNENVISNIIIPSNEEIESAKKLCELDRVLSFDYSKKKLTKLVSGAKIDLGGIAKGYAIDKVKTILIQDGVTDGYISFGSSSVYIFDANSISIRHPRNQEKNIIKISSPKDISISTSGDYERVFGSDSNGKIYSHIIDTTSGFPTDTGIISATVIGENGAILDGFSTSLMLCNFDKNNKENSELTLQIKKYIDTFGEIKFFICFDKGEKYLITNANSQEFELLDKEYTIVNI